MLLPIRFPCEPNLPVAPQATGATWSSGLLQATVTFDQGLQAGPFDLANWPLTYATGTALPIAALLPAGPGGDTLVLTYVALMTGVSQIAYDPPPLDVIGTNGLPVVAFVEVF